MGCDTDGEGVQIFSETVRYEGGFKQGRRHGKGFMALPTGEEFVGDWNEGQMYKGTLKRAYKDILITYTGSFANSKKEGKGLLLHGDLVVYEGLWRENKVRAACRTLTMRTRLTVSELRVRACAWQQYHGTGTHTLPDGSVFKGTFVQGKRDGMGRMVYANGDVYEGQWSGDEVCTAWRHKRANCMALTARNAWGCVDAWLRSSHLEGGTDAVRW